MIFKKFRKLISKEKCYKKLQNQKYFWAQVIWIIAFFNLKLIFAGNFVLEEVDELESQAAFVVADGLFSDQGLFQKKIQIGAIGNM